MDTSGDRHNCHTDPLERKLKDAKTPGRKGKIKASNVKI